MYIYAHTYMYIFLTNNKHSIFYLDVSKIVVFSVFISTPVYLLLNVAREANKLIKI